MKLYIVMSEWLGGGESLGVFTSLELAQKGVKKWCVNHNDEWEMPEAVFDKHSHYVNNTECGEWWLSIKEFEANELDQLENEE